MKVMKKLFLMIVPALICGAMFTGCSTESIEPTTGELYVFGAAKTRASSETDLVFTGDDIISFNTRYGEIVFTESKFDEIMSRINLHTELHFFIGDNPVFDPPIKIHYGWGLSNDDFDLQFRTDGERTYLTNFYMHIDSIMPQSEKEIRQIEAIREKREKELEILIKYFAATGKITEQDAPLPIEPENSQPNCNKYVIISDSLYATAPNDNFEIIDMKIEGNCLKIKFSASGCSGDSWIVELIDSGVVGYLPTFAPPPLPTRTLKFFLDNKEECRAWITKEVCFNIEGLQIKGMNIVNLNILGNNILYKY